MFDRYIKGNNKSFSEKYHFFKSLERTALNANENIEFNFNLSSIKEIQSSIQENLFTTNKIYMEKIYEISSKIGNLLEDPSKNSQNLNIKDNLFINNPIDLLQKPPIKLKNGCFTTKFAKSSLSCGFRINNEAYLAWAGYQNNPYPLIIYNLCTKKQELSIKFDRDSCIRVVSTFPKYDNEVSSAINWLYVANERIFKCFDISPNSNNKFQELNSFQTDQGEIRAAVIFKDKFKEINENNGIYAVVSFNGGENALIIYRYANNEEKKTNSWEKFKKIDGLFKVCYTISYYPDDISSKTYLFFGFHSIPMRLYNLQDNSWDKSTSFPTYNNSYICSIEFFTIKINKEYKKFVIYTQSYSDLIIIGDIDTGKIVQQISIPNSYGHRDLLIWNCRNTKQISNNSEVFLIIASWESDYLGKSSINIVRLEENMSLALRKTIYSDIYPVNLIKLKITPNKVENDKNQQEIRDKDILAVIYGEGSNSKVTLYGE